MEKKFALIGLPKDTAAEAAKLKEKGYKHHRIHKFRSEISTDKLLGEIIERQINHVICIKTRHGQTGYWATTLADIQINDTPIQLFGIDIPPHHQRIVHKGMALLTHINCVTEITLHAN